MSSEHALSVLGPGAGKIDRCDGRVRQLAPAIGIRLRPDDGRVRHCPSGSAGRLGLFLEGQARAAGVWRLGLTGRSAIVPAWRGTSLARDRSPAVSRLSGLAGKVRVADAALVDDRLRRGGPHPLTPQSVWHGFLRRRPVVLARALVAGGPRDGSRSTARRQPVRVPGTGELAHGHRPARWSRQSRRCPLVLPAA